MVVLKQFTEGVCDYFSSKTSDNFEEEDLVLLKKIISDGIIKNKDKLPKSEGPVAETNNSLKFKSSVDTGKTPSTSAYTLCWNEWKKNNPQKEWLDPDDESNTNKLTAHKYWKRHIWDKMSKEEKKPYDDEANKIKASYGGGQKVKRKVSKSGFLLFCEKMKTKMEPSEVFSNPLTGENLKTHHYLLWVWSNHIKIKEDLIEPFNSVAKELKDGVRNDYDIDELPYVDPDKLRQYDFEDLLLIYEKN